MSALSNQTASGTVPRTPVNRRWKGGPPPHCAALATWVLGARLVERRGRSRQRKTEPRAPLPEPHLARSSDDTGRTQLSIPSANIRRSRGAPRSAAIVIVWPSTAHHLLGGYLDLGSSGAGNGSGIIRDSKEKKNRKSSGDRLVSTQYSARYNGWVFPWATYLHRPPSSHARRGADLGDATAHACPHSTAFNSGGAPGFIAN